MAGAVTELLKQLTSTYKPNELLTPIKAIKGTAEQERQRNKAADGLYSAAVSSVKEGVCGGFFQQA